jgi:hypothetical protein
MIYPLRSTKSRKARGSTSLATELLRKTIQKIRPDTTPDNLKKYSTHLLHLRASVLQDEAGKSPRNIQKRLRWLGDFFRMYLKDATIIQNQHLDALQAAL